ncbi:hypothetical protein BLOT_014443 [Blomia tropicalis]|nr:hypothetical protein BLOT_014443 [Blomia tropicalis]
MCSMDGSTFFDKEQRIYIIFGQLKNEKEKCVEIKKKLNKILNRRVDSNNRWNIRTNAKLLMFYRAKHFSKIKTIKL